MSLANSGDKNPQPYLISALQPSQRRVSREQRASDVGETTASGASRRRRTKERKKGGSGARYERTNQRSLLSWPLGLRSTIYVCSLRARLRENVRLVSRGKAEFSMRLQPNPVRHTLSVCRCDGWVGGYAEPVS